MKTNGSRAFSLLELFVVLSLVVLIAAIGIGVSASMADAGRIRSTELILQTLDQTLDGYVREQGDIPPALVEIRLDEDMDSLNLDRSETVYFPAIDGRIIRSDNGTFTINSVGAYLASVRDAVDIEGALSHVDRRFLRNHDVVGDGQPSLLTAFDAWGNPIRYVHPRFDGILTEPGTQRALGEPGEPFDNAVGELFHESALPVDTGEILFGHTDSPFASEIRRNKILGVDQEEASRAGLAFPVVTDSDGGLCPGARPYFYSAGPDGDPATVEDNIYTREPDFVDPL